MSISTGSSSANVILPGLTGAPITMPKPAPISGNEFSSLLSGAIERVEAFRASSEKAVERFLSGEDEDIHRVALETQRAELAFELFLQVKNKALQAYQEIMRMQV